MYMCAEQHEVHVVLGRNVAKFRGWWGSRRGSFWTRVEGTLSVRVHPHGPRFAQLCEEPCFDWYKEFLTC